MVGATRPGRVLLLFAVVVACHVTVGGVVWYASLAAPVSCERNVGVVAALPTQRVSETAEEAVPEPQPSRASDHGNVQGGFGGGFGGGNFGGGNFGGGNFGGGSAVKVVIDGNASG